MLKKGFKALKSIGKKSKKKEKGDGDNVSQPESVNDAELGATALAKDNRLKAAAAAHSDVGSGERVGAAASYARSPGRGQPTLAQSVGSASTSSLSASGRPALTRPTSVDQSTREVEAEESVVAMMRELQAKKEAGKQAGKQTGSEPAGQTEMLDDSDEDSDSDGSVSSETDLTYKKKLKHDQEKEERRKKGLSVTSSSSEESSWGDTSDVLPSPSNKPPLLAQSTNPVTVAAAARKPAATAADAAEDSNSAWSDSDEEADESQPRQASPSRALASPDIMSEPASTWSDDEGDVKQPAGEDKSKTTASSVPDLLPAAEVAQPALPENVSEPPLNATYEVPSVVKKADIVSDSDSQWSDSWADDVAVDPPTSAAHKPAAVDVTSATQVVASGTKDLGDDGLLSKPSQSIAAASDETSAQPPVLARLESQESAWSDDEDSIELAAAPTNSAPILAATNGSSTHSPPVEPVVEPKVEALTNQSMNQTVTIDTPLTPNVTTAQHSQKLDEEVQAISRQLADSEQRENSLVQEKEELKKELVSVQKERDELQRTVGSLEDKMEDLQSLNEKLTEAEGSTVKRSMYDDVTRKLKVIMDENERLVAQHSENEKTSSAEAAGLRQEIEQLENLQKQHVIDEGEWDKVREELKCSVSSWEINYSQLESTLSQHKQANSELEAEIGGLREKQVELQSQRTEMELQRERTTGDAAEVEMLKAELKEKVRQLEMLREDMERSTTEYSDKISRLSSRITEMNTSHDQEIQSMTDKHRHTVTQLNEDHDRDIQRAEMRQDSLSKEISSLQSQNKDLQQKNSKLRTEMSEKSKDLISKRDYEDLQKDHDLLQLKVTELQKLSGQSGVIEPEQSPLVSNFNFSASSSDDDDDIRHQRLNGNTSLVISNAQQKELERLEEKVKQLKREVSDLEQSTSLLQTEKRTLSRQLQERQDESDDLKVQNDKLYEKLRVRDQEVTMELNKKLEIELVADSERSKLRQEAVLAESNVARLTEANSHLESKLAAVTAELGIKDSRLRSQGEAKGQEPSLSDAEMVRLSTELAQLKSSADAERATYMAAIESKEREVTAEIAEKESAKAALDEVTKSLMYVQDDINSNYISLSTHQEALSRVNEQEDRMHRELSSMREKVETYSKDALEAKNVCSMQQILINEKDRELRDKEKEMRGLRRDLDGKAEALSTANSQLQQSARDRDRDQDRLRGEMLNLSLRHDSPTRGDSMNYKTMYDELRVDREREKATADQLIERLKWEISTLEERLQNAKSELQDKVKLETNYLLSQGEADRYKQEAAELVRKSTRLEERVDQLQRETDHLKDSRLEVGSSNQTLRDENSRVREENVYLKSQLENVQRELSGYSVTRDEMEAALATAKLTTDVNDMTRQDSENEVQLERKHKMVLYKQAKNLRTEINEKNVKLQELERMTDKLKAKVVKLKAENNALNVRLRDRVSAETQRSWDMSTGLTQADLYQQEVKQLQSQLEVTNNDMQSQAKKAKARKQDLSYFQSKAEDLEKKNQQLSIKLSDSVLMVEAAERTSTDLRNHIAQLNGRLQQYEDLEDSTDMTMQELRGSRRKENRDLEREVGELKKRLSLAESGRSTPRSRSTSPTPSRRRSRTSSSRYGGQPLTEYEKDRRALTRAAWAVLDDHGMGPPAEQRVFENLDRIWRRNASRPSRYM